MNIFLILIFSILLVTPSSFAQKKGSVQKINFDETDVNGRVRQPDGSYIVQKKGVEFIPLYKIKEDFNQQVESSVDYIK